MSQQEIWEQLASVRYGLIELSSFEQWIYTVQDLEAVVGQNHYLALVSFVFNQPHAKHELTRVIDHLYEEMRPLELRRDAATAMAHAFLDGRVDLIAAARMFTRFRNEGESWVPDEFVYIDSELDDLPMPAEYPNWDQHTLAATLAEWQPRLAEFERAARETSREMLLKLERNS